MDNIMYDAFFNVCPSAEKCETWYVVLWEYRSYYGGPEEGGWWGRDCIPVAIAEYNTQFRADAMAKQVYARAKEMTKQAQNEFNDYCLNSILAAEERGLSSEDLPEVDGAPEYKVYVQREYPEAIYGPRHYE